MANVEKTQLICVEGRDGPTFGGRVFFGDGSVFEFSDIHPNGERAGRFLDSLCGEEAEETQLWYYLEDFLAQ